MSLRDFLMWWLDQLASLVPAAWRHSWFVAGRATQVEIDRGRVSVSTPGNGPAITFELPNDDPDGQGFHPNLDAIVRPGLNKLDVRLAPGDFLVRHFPLPVAARSHLEEAVRYQLPRLIPFSSSQVLYACGIAGARLQNDQLNVWLVAIPRQRILPAFRLFGMGDENGRLLLRQPPEPGDWLHFSWRTQGKSGFAAGRRRWLWAGALAGLIGAFVLHLVNRENAFDTLSASLSEMRVEAASVGELRDRLTRVTSQIDWLYQKKRSSVPSLDVLDVLTRELADDTSLSRFDRQGLEVLIDGVSPSPAALIEKLEETPLFDGVRFESAITQDARSDGSRFSIRARLHTPVDGDGA